MFFSHPIISLALSSVSIRLLTLFLIAVISVKPAFAQSFSFVYEDKENYPAFVGDGTDIPEFPGTYVDILREVSKRLDLDLQLERRPWVRALNEFKRGLYDAINGSYKLEREAFAEYPRDALGRIDTSLYITRDAYVLFTKKGQPVPVDDHGKLIPGTRIAVPYGYSIASDLREQGVKVEEWSGLESLVRMLLAERVEGVVLHERPMLFFLLEHESFRDQLNKYPQPLAAKNYYIMLSKQFVSQQPELAQKIWATIAQVRVEQYEALEAFYANRRRETQ